MLSPMWAQLGAYDFVKGRLGCILKDEEALPDLEIEYITGFRVVTSCGHHVKCQTTLCSVIQTVLSLLDELCQSQNSCVLKHVLMFSNFDQSLFASFEMCAEHIFLGFILICSSTH